MQEKLKIKNILANVEALQTIEEVLKLGKYQFNSFPMVDKSIKYIIALQVSALDTAFEIATEKDFEEIPQLHKLKEEHEKIKKEFEKIETQKEAKSE
jgi:hypothetical protein